jgi:6,7-dimethyl-8-ribityllumazine synthase
MMLMSSGIWGRRWSHDNSTHDVTVLLVLMNFEPSFIFADFAASGMWTDGKTELDDGVVVIVLVIIVDVTHEDLVAGEVATMIA